MAKVPITFWTTACSKLKKHEEKSQLHKSSMAKMENFLKVMAMEQPSTAECMNSSTAAQINANRQKLASIIKTIVFCGHQNIALRGHRESSTDPNPGNFKSLLEFRVESGDQILQNHFENAPRNAVYTSNTIQKDIVAVIAEWMHEKLFKEIAEGSGIFTIIADEASRGLCYQGADASNSSLY